MGRPRMAGLVMSVQEMRTKDSCGIGDFGDLKTMIGWAADSGLHVVQIQPVNDNVLDWADCNTDPYSAVSRYALNPLFADLRRLNAQTTKQPNNQAIKQPNGQLTVDEYAAIYKSKLRLLRVAYQEEKDTLCDSETYTKWLLRQKEWLPEYAALCCRRDKEDDEEFYFYVQYLLSCQLEEARQYARSRHVILWGDVPVEAFPQDYDIWQQPQELHRYFDACRFDTYLRCKVPETIGEMRMLTLLEHPMVTERDVQDPSLLPYFSISMIRAAAVPQLWWKALPVAYDRVYGEILHRRDTKPRELSRWLARDIAMRTLMAPSMICLLSWDEWLQCCQQDYADIDAALASIASHDDIREILVQTYRNQ